MQIAERQTLKQILSGITQIEWSSSYKPALSQVHDHMLQQDAGAPARRSLSLIRDFGTRMRVNRIIKAVGLENFVGAAANEVLSELDSVYTERSDTGMDRGRDIGAPGGRSVREFSPDEAASTYVYEAPEQQEEAEEVAPVEPGETEEDAAEMEAQEEEAEKSRLELTVEKVEAYKAKSYPEWRKTVAESLFKNMSILLKNIQDYYLPYNKDPDPVLDTFDSWFEDLDKFLTETTPPAAPAPSKKKKSGRVARKFQSTLDADDDANLEDEGKSASSLDDNAALSADFLSGLPPFISLREDGVPTFNTEAIDTAYSAVVNKLSALRVQTEQAAVGKKKVGKEYSKAFNEIFHSVKVKDWETRVFIIDNETQIRQALGGAADMERFKREANKYYLSSRLKDDMNLFQDIYWALAYCISYSLFGHIQNTKPVTFRTGAGTNLDQGSIDMDELRENYLSRAMNRIRSKYFMVLDINAPKFYRTRADTIAELKIQTGILIKRTFRQLHGSQEGQHTVYFRKSLCPVCFKEIRWSRPDALKSSDEYRDFEVPTVVPFNIGKGIALTEDVMSENGPYDPPEGMRGKKTWEQIKEMIASNKVSMHREGWVRRAAALMAMGGENVGTTNITKSMFRCPYPTERSSCGISLNPLTQEESLLPKAPADLSTTRDKIDYAKELLSIEPSKLDRATYESAVAMIDPISREEFADVDEYREVKRGLRLIRTKVSDVIGYGGLTQPGWTPASLQTNNGSLKSRLEGTDPSLKQRMSQQASGGYKFSSSTFRCPCHITPDMIKGTTSGGHVQHTHFTYAMPYSGIFSGEKEGQVLPTSPLGTPSMEIQEGAFGYLVCGAQTSLSSFDRDIGNETGFINMMRAIYGENQNLFLSLTEYFLKEGVDVSDIMTILPYVSKGGPSPEEGMEATAEIHRIRDRIERLAELFSQGMARRGDELFDKLKEFVLVCPFGHKFKIDDSLKFGESHSSMSLRNEKMSAYNDVVRGKAQSWEYLVGKGNLVPVDPNSIRNYQYYEEWSLAPTKSRVLSIFNIQSKLAKLSSDARYDLVKSLTFLKFKGPDGDYAYSDTIRLAQQAWTGVGNAQPLYTSLDFVSGGPREVSDTQVDGQSTTPSGSATARQYREEAFKIDNADTVTPIPGSDTLDEADWDEYVDSKRLSLARAIRSALNIIVVFNNGIVDDQMARIFTVRQEHETDVTSVARTALSEVAALPGMNADSAAEWAEANVEAFEAAIRENVETFGIIKPSDTSRDIAVEVLSDALTRFVMSSGGDAISQPRKVTRELRKAVPRIVNSLIQDNTALVAFLSSSSHAGQKLVRSSHREQYIQKMFLLAFSSHLASSIANIANDYFVEGSDRYIGYDIGLDLTDYEAVMRLSPSDLERLEEVANTALDDYSIFGDPMSTTGAEDYTDKIDKAYLRLIHIINWGNRFALSAHNVEKAKQYVSDTLSSRNDETSEWFRSELEKFFPVAKMDLAHSHSSVWLSRRVPITGSRGGHQILDMPDTRFPDGAKIVNPSINFDSSKMQVGMIAARPAKEPESGGRVDAQLWPPTKQGYSGGGFVGLTIPVRKGTAINTEAGSVELKVLSHSVIVDMGGEPVDVSFLFQRGFTEEDYMALERIEGLIDEAEEQYSRAIEKLGSEVSGEEYDTQVAALKDAHELRLSELRGRREEVPLRYRTDTTSYYFDPRSAGRTLPMLPLEEFTRKFATPEKKKTYAGYPGHRKSEVAEIVPRVLDMYSRFNKTQDPTIEQMIVELTNKLARYQAERQSTEVSMMMTDPIQAFRLINSTALTGREIGDETRTKLLDFIMDIYGGWRVLEIAQRVQANRDAGKADSERLGPVNVEELLTMKKPDGTMWSDAEIKLLNKELRKGDVGDSEGWANHTGVYYDIYQGDGEEDGDDKGSHIQYVYGVHTEKSSPAQKPPVGGIPSISDIRNVKSHSETYGLAPSRRKKKTRGRKPDPAAIAKKMANRARASMLRYIKNSTSGATEVRPKPHQNEIIDKISKRRNNVAGIIIDSRIEDLLPDTLVEEAMLEVYYDNIIHGR